MIRILILGGGFGGIYTLKHLHKFYHQKQDIKLILIDKNNYFLFTPLLHEVATGAISFNNILEPLRETIKCCNIDFFDDEIIRINLKEKNIETKNLKLFYDYLVIALGSKTAYYNIPGASNFSFPLKTIDDALKIKNHIIDMFEKTSLNLKDIEEPLTFVIVGGGATGLELAGELADLIYKTFSKVYPRNLIDKTKIILIEKNKELIPQFSSELRKKALERLKKLKIIVLLERGVIEVGEDFIKLDNGETIKTKTVIWTAGVEPNLPEIIGDIEKDRKNRIIVNEYLQIKNYENVFALGDICCFFQNNTPLPQLAQVAFKQSKIVALNIKNLIENKPLQKFIYKHSGDLISIGKFYALGEIKGLNISGIFAWFLWRGVYLTKFISLRGKLKNLFDWILNLFLLRDIAKL